MKEHIATITFTREQAANALSTPMLHELQEVLHCIKNDSSIRVVIVTGAGDKAFCAGADLKERQQMNEQQVIDTVALISETIYQIETLPQPVIAAINGVAFGGGLELALACDIRCATNIAKLGLTETSLGIIPGAGGTQRLPRLIGLGLAKEMIYTAKRLTAEQAQQFGIVEHVVSKDDLMVFTNNLANEIAQNAPLSLIQAKYAINKGLQVDLLTGLQIEQQAYKEILYTKDRLEGLAAFQQKRKPNFTGN